MHRTTRLLAAALVVPAVTVLSTAAAATAPAQAGAPVAAAVAGLADTPPMGFNNWNAFGCDVSDRLIRETADAMVRNGMKAAGYQYVNIDDCWSLRERDAAGRLVPDPVKFPDGIKGVADYVHGLGLKLGIYGDAGTLTCANYPGSLGHEVVDAQTWADWGVDYLKYDNCNNQSDGSQADYVRRYTAMRDALRATGRPIVYSICEWGTSQPWTWAAGVGQLWRTTGDITDSWDSVRSIIAQNAPLASYAGPGRWNDPDMLEIGNGGMTNREYRTHMSMWAMMAAPLIVGSDLRNASAATLDILTNRQIIAIDQDPLGVQGAVVSDEGGLLVLDKPLADGSRAIALYNSTDRLATVAVPAADTGLTAAPAYRLTDVWTGEVSQARTTIAAAVPAHGTVVYRVLPTRSPATLPPSVTVDAGIGTLVPGADSTATLTTTVTNRGAGGIKDVVVRVKAPEGWRVRPATTSTRSRLATDAALTTTWTVRVPEGTDAGTFPLTATATYYWGERGRRATSTSTVDTAVVTGPADGHWFLSALPSFSARNPAGPIEIDQSVGGAGIADGNLITVAARYYTRGIGTVAPGEIVYYLEGRCTGFSTQVGIDDEAAGGPATFTVYADDQAVATSGPMASGAAAKTLTADLSGVRWLRLATTGDGAHTDWVAPTVTCGDASPTDPAQPAERTLFSFEDGTEDFTIANPGSGGTVAQTGSFATEGGHGLQVTTPVSGNWFGKRLAEPLDLTGASMVKFDVRAGDAGTSGEIALQIGDGEQSTWCQGGRWAWTNAHASRTITETVEHIECPSGTELDLSDVTGVWVFLNGGGVAAIDNIRTQ